MKEKEKQIAELAETISKFMGSVPGEDDREWDSGKMAEFLLDAGYRLPAPLSPISDTEIERIATEENDPDFYQELAPAVHDLLHFVIDAQLAADRKAMEKEG